MSFVKLLENIHDARQVNDLSKIGTLITQHYNYTHYLFVLQQLHTPTNSENFTLTNYPLDWQEYYQSSGAIRMDPLINHSLGSITPITWQQLEKKLTKSHRSGSFFQVAAEFGFRSGITIPIRSTQGYRGLLTFTKKNETHNQLNTRLMDSLPDLCTLALFYCEAATRLNCQTEGELQKLTPRELEIMKWVAEGKDNEMIASILKVSVSAVAFHIRNIYKKLGAANRANAVARAFITGAMQDAY